MNRAFESDQISYVKLCNVPDSDLSTLPPRPDYLPEYIILHDEISLKTDEQDMSLVDIIDFGKGQSSLNLLEYLTDIFFVYSYNQIQI